MIESTTASTQRARALVALREMVLRGDFPPGKRIEEIELGRHIGVSRPVLRSILEHLVHEGLLEELPSGGYTAHHFTIQDIRDAIAARAVLEGFAASLAAVRNPNPAELEPARRLNAELAQSLGNPAPDQIPSLEQMSRFGERNAAFHDALVAMAHSPMLRWCIQRVQSVAFASPAAVVLPAESDGGRRAVDEHDAILNAIESGDAAKAEALVRQHGRLAIYGLESALEGRALSRSNIGLALVGPKSTKAKAESARAPLAKRIENGSGVTSSGVSSPSITAERILDSAAELFCEKGFHAATTRELAARLNIHQASLYHHMSSKEDLLRRVCHQAMRSFLTEVPEALKTANTGHKRIEVFIDAHLATTVRHPYLTLAMVTEFRALSRQHLAEFAGEQQAYSQILEAELDMVLESGNLRTDIPLKYLRLGLLNYLNWTPRWFRSGGSLSRTDLASIYQRVFWEGVASPGTRRLPSPGPLAASDSRPRPREVHRGTLGKFIRAAAGLFAKHGYGSTSTRSLATLLGTEKATLYYHVEGKEDLLYAICRSSIEQLTSDVEEAVEGIEDPLEQLRVLIQAQTISLLRDQTQHATALAEVRALSPDRLAEIVNMRKMYQARMRSMIEAGQRSGQIRDDVAPKYLGLMLEGLLDRTVIWYSRKGDLSPSQLGAHLCEIFISGAQNGRSGKLQP